MYIKPTFYIVENTSYPTLSRNKDRLAVVRITINSFYRRRANKEWVFAILDFVLVITRASFYMCDITKPFHLPLTAEPRQSPLASQQLLHRPLLDIPFFGDELFQGFNESIRIGERCGDGFLLGFGRGYDNRELELGSNPNVRTGSTSRQHF